MLNKIYTYKIVRKINFILQVLGGCVAFSSVFSHDPTVRFYLLITLPATIIYSEVTCYRYFRCPYCREFLGWRTPNNIKYCPHCGKSLTLT